MKASRLPLPRKNLTQCPGSVDHYISYAADFHHQMIGGAFKDIGLPADF